MIIKKTAVQAIVFCIIAGLLSMNYAYASLSESDYGINSDIFKRIDSRADFNYKYLGTTSEEDSYNAENLNTGEFEWKKGGYIWVGVTLSNMSRTPELADGLESIETSIVYDNRYLLFDDSYGEEMFEALTVLNDTDPDIGICYGYHETVGFEFDYAQHEDWKSEALIGSSPLGAASELHESLCDGGVENLSEAIITMGHIRRSYILDEADDVDDEEHLLIVFAFEMISDEAPVYGKKIIQGYSNPVTTVLHCGSHPLSYQQYSYEKTNLGYWFNISDQILDVEMGEVVKAESTDAPIAPDNKDRVIIQVENPVSVTVKISDEAEQRSLQGILIHTKYREDNTLRYLKLYDLSGGEEITNTESVIEVKDTVEPGDKLMVWNSLSGMVPYGSYIRNH